MRRTEPNPTVIPAKRRGDGRAIGYWPKRTAWIRARLLDDTYPESQQWACAVNLARVYEQHQGTPEL